MPINRETGAGLDGRNVVAKKLHVYGTGNTVDPCMFIYRMLHEHVKHDGKWVEGEPTPYHLAVDITFPDGTYEKRIADIWFGGGSNHYNEPRISATKKGLSDEILDAILIDISEEKFGRSPPSPEGDDGGETHDKEEQDG